MAFISLNPLLKEAKKRKYAVGQFNANGLIWFQSILKVAESKRSPVIVATSDRLVDYLGGFKTIVALVSHLMAEMKITVPVVLHLDHSQTVKRCIEAIDAGFSSVMYDGSHLPIDENINNTKTVVDYAHPKGVSVESEVGAVGGMEDGLVSGIKYADINECIRMVAKTNVDALAPALGSVHGKYQGKPVLGFKQMEEISKKTKIPLVLHGASGIPAPQMKKAIALGHSKININTECNVAWRNQMTKSLIENPDVFEPRLLTLPSVKAIEEVIAEKMDEFGSSYQAESAASRAN